MPKLLRRTVILAKAESSYGVDEVPTAADGLLVNMSPEITGSGDKIERDPVRDSLSPLGHIIGAKEYSLQIEVEAKGGGIDTVLQAPEFDALLLACAMQKTTLVALPVDDESGFTIGETITGGTSAAEGNLEVVLPGLLLVEVTSGTFSEAAEVFTGGTSANTANGNGAPYESIQYRPLSDPSSMQSASIYFNRDGILHKAIGCRGNFSMNVSVGGIPTFRFDLRGLFADPTDTAMVTPTTLDLTPPVAHGIGLKIGTMTPVANALSLDMGNTLGQRRDVNAAEGVTELMITGRRPSGSIDPEVDSLANFNPWDSWKNATPALIHCTIGSAPGNRITPVVPKALYEEVRYSEREGLLTYDLPFVAKMDTSAGDDEFRLIFS